VASKEATDLRIQNKGDGIAAYFSFGPVPKTVHLHDASFFWCGVCVRVRVSLWNSIQQLTGTMPRLRAQGF